jgi:hypothetical protein
VIRDRSPEEDRLLELRARRAADFEAANYDFGASRPNVVAFYWTSAIWDRSIFSQCLDVRRERLPVDLFI